MSLLFDKDEKNIRILKRSTDQLDAKQVLAVVEQYTMALDLLDDYDHQCIGKPEGIKNRRKRTYDETGNELFSLKRYTPYYICCTNVKSSTTPSSGS